MNFTPVLITLAAGLATVIGALFVSEKRHPAVEAFFLAFAAGIMLMVSLGELLPETFEVMGILPSLGLMVLGAGVSLLLDVLLPHEHEHGEEPGHYINECECSHSSTVSWGMVAALLLHNVIEGLATGVTVVSDARLGGTMALGIAIHNIPIGTTLAVSVISSGKKKGRAVLDAALVGMAQPLGALAGLLVFGGSVNETALSCFTAAVAGILIFISFDELWPAARAYKKRNLSITALVLGICLIPVTELFSAV